MGSGILFLLIFLGIWVSLAVYCIKRRVSLVLSIGGGFLVALLILFSGAAFISSVLHWQKSSPPEIVQNSKWDGSVSQVEGYLKVNLKDPKSFEAIEWSEVVKTGKGYMVRCKYRAKNSFGGYAIENKVFMLDQKGSVISAFDHQP